MGIKKVPLVFSPHGKKGKDGEQKRNPINFSPDNERLGVVFGKGKKAFTLVELIIVITILAILATIAFMSFQGYTSRSRDSNRLSTMKNIETGLSIFFAKSGMYPEPDNKIQILASGSLLGYEGRVGSTVSRVVSMNERPQDPLDQKGYLYSISKSKTKYQIMGYMENSDYSNTAFVTQTYAQDRIERFPKTLGEGVGIVVSPDQSLPPNNVDVVTDGGAYTVVFTDKESVSGTGVFTEIYNHRDDLLHDMSLASYDPSLVGYRNMESTVVSGTMTLMEDKSQYHNHAYCRTDSQTVNCQESNQGPQTATWEKNTGKNLLFGINVNTSLLVHDSTSLNITTNEVTIVGMFQFDVNPTQTRSVYPILLIKRPWVVGGYASHFMKVSGTIIQQYCYASYCDAANSPPLIKGKIYHYVGVKTPTQLKIYLDGVLVSVAPITQPMGLSPLIDLSIGNDFEGKIDEIRVYNRSLSESEVRALYTSVQ